MPNPKIIAANIARGITTKILLLRPMTVFYLIHINSKRIFTIL